MSVSTTPCDPICQHCGKPIVGQSFYGRGGPYHPECTQGPDYPMAWTTTTKTEPALSLRQWLTGMALLGILAKGEPEDAKHNAIVAVRNADAVIEQMAEHEAP